MKGAPNFDQLKELYKGVKNFKKILTKYLIDKPRECSFEEDLRTSLFFMGENDGGSRTSNHERKTRLMMKGQYAKYLKIQKVKVVKLNVCTNVYCVTIQPMRRMTLWHEG